MPINGCVHAEGYADARADLKVARAHLERRACGGDDFLGDDVCVRAFANARLGDRELVTPQSSHGTDLTWLCCA